jgi:glycosyltransferase involved in cell wall biosynthesis/GT2 family glycosyltransferase
MVESGQKQNMKVAVVVTESGAAGGAERFYGALAGAIEQLGHEVELVSRPAPEPDFETICANYEAFSSLELSEFDAVISTKAPTYAVSHPNHVVYLVHTVRAFDDMFESLFAPVEREMAEKRQRLHRIDFRALCGAKKIFTIGSEVSDRLYKWRGLNSEVIHPPLAVDGFRNDGVGDYFFMPGRLHAWKRVSLVIEAVKSSDLPMRLLISGTGEEEKQLRKLADGDKRIEFLGHISDSELVDLYAGALAIPFVPVREDYGYVTLEAFASGKPVLTCSDSGEPVRFVSPGENGLLCDPSVEAVREGLEWLFRNPEEAAGMGEAGRKLIEGMSWSSVAERLLSAAVSEPMETEQSPLMRVTTVDMQPIDPPVGGGRLRLLGLYHNLGDNSVCHYVGTYDWPGESFRDHWLTKRLREISVPLSNEHHGAAADLALRCGGKTVIDLAFSQQGRLSGDFVSRVREEIREADVVVFSHPWVYPLVADTLKPNQVVVYDSHNVEGFLRAQLLDESNPEEKAVLRQAVADEYDMGSRADLILACSQEDLARFNRIYEFAPDKMRVIPNGVMAFSMKPAPSEERALIRKKLSLKSSSFIAVFIGSPYGPNVEAAEFIANDLARELPDITFVIAGGVGEMVSGRERNLVCTGRLEEADKLDWLRASDIAVNPMFSGSGTNIKMFDFMALGLPVVVTETGARGIEEGASQCFVRVPDDRGAFKEAVARLRTEKTLRQYLAASARECVETRYSWERISAHLGTVLRNRAHWGSQDRPFFSVIVPSYARHDRLTELMTALSAQIERDFEVIIVDQSATRWPDENKPFGVPVTYIHTDIKGAVGARNTGAAIACGEVLAFTDDDCLPKPEWLLHARTYFGDDAVVGVEGMVVSDHYGEPDWRPVTNVGFEGVGFMTANLLVRSSAFQLLGGFDLSFDKPHFREDTDFGWRMQGCGIVPYGNDVVVYHPAQQRSDQRESIEARAVFFKKDALLYKKHPEKYRELFFYERQFEKYPGFSENLEAGFAETGVAMPGWLKDAIAR